MATRNGYYMDMARRLERSARKALGGGWVYLTHEVRKALVLADASSVILGWTGTHEGGTATLEMAQELLRCVHEVMEPADGGSP